MRVSKNLKKYYFRCRRSIRYCAFSAKNSLRTLAKISRNFNSKVKLLLREQGSWLVYIKSETVLIDKTCYLVSQ
jgi:hypothetical protein